MKADKITNKKSKVLSARILRAVASSSAIETNETVHVIEERLKSGQRRFSKLKLAL